MGPDDIGGPTGNGRQDRASEPVNLTAIYVGGPLGGTTEEMSVVVDRVEGAGKVWVPGFDFWSDGSGPAGQYRPDTTVADGSVKFFWDEYGPEERAELARTGRPVWHEYSPEQRARLANTTQPSVVPARWEVFDSIGLPFRNPPGRADESVRLTAIYLGGPHNGTTEEFEAHPKRGDEPGIVRLKGFDVWPMEPGAMTPGRYDPKTSWLDGPQVPFIWREYTTEEQVRRVAELGLRGYGPKRRKRRIPRRIREWTERARFGRRRG